jgi:hypothetical protein
MNKKYFKFLISIYIVISFSILFFLFYEFTYSIIPKRMSNNGIITKISSKLKDPTNVKFANEEASSSTSKIDEIANSVKPNLNEINGKNILHSYRNTEFGFEFKYPGEIKVNKESKYAKIPIYFQGNDYSFWIDIFDKNGRSPKNQEEGPGIDARSIFLYFPDKDFLDKEKDLITKNKGDKFIDNEKRIKCMNSVPLDALCYIEKFNENLIGLVYYYFPMNGSWSKFIVFFDSSGNRFLISTEDYENYADISDFKTKSKLNLSTFNMIISNFGFFSKIRN